MAQQLYYGMVSGVSPFTTWQMGMYFQTSVLTPTAVANAWSAWLFNFFTAGTIHAFGYSTLMYVNQNVTGSKLYTIDDVTDRKTPTPMASFSGTGTASGHGMPAAVAPLVLLQPATMGHHGSGRLYLPPASVNLVQNSVISTGNRTLIMDFLQDAFAQMTSNQLFPVIRDRVRHTSKLVSQYWLSSILANVPSREIPGFRGYTRRSL